MLLAGLQLLTFMIYLAGMIICVIGMQSKKLLYKGGFFFFLFSLLSILYSTILRFSMDSIIQRLTDRGASIGLWLANLGIPAVLLNFIGLIILVACLLSGLFKTDHANKDIS